MTPALFTPLRIGNFTVTNRIAMAPLTRYRADDIHVHTKMAIEYYLQRCHTPGTLLITEATFISPRGAGYNNIPMIQTPEQIESWRQIVAAVHGAGCFIALQQWCLGRAATPDVIRKEGAPFVSSSNVPIVAGSEAPRPLTVAEIKVLVDDYSQAARNFIEGAGGDAVEIHGANGYMIDQFTQNTSNTRTDSYGGSAENRTRFAREVVDAVCAAVGDSRVALRLSPFSTFQGMKMSSLQEIKSTFGLLVNWLAKNHSDMAYLHVVEGRVAGVIDVAPSEQENLDFIFDVWTPRPFMIAGGFVADTAYAAAERRQNTLVAFGRYFISNPDLVSRVKNGQSFEPYNRKTFYKVKSPEGYTDYLPSTETPQPRL